ncbi:hypothetical protein CJ010_00735 [Azoarcus sp. DD4]|uniref:hypothetical protein n=1 Tax=Azoarcus sp. DD4 TaxID=2027405 RepID=UPI00112D273F|nr:hypothetical protein [Azoarcus sp. DD4]QDF95179.1 hypothetical protein CJ010_00735 [Azoarcus sp. DD4]
MSPIAQYAAQFGPVPRWLALAALVAAGAAAGGWIVAQVKNSELAELRTEQTERVTKAERLARERLQAAQARGDELTVRLAAANESAATLQKELDDALSKVTTGRPCLGGAALRVLDRAPGIAAPRMPAPARVAPAADAAHPAAPAAQPAARDEGDAATDTDVARWALHAAGEYGECTRRLGALIDWHDER